MGDPSIFGDLKASQESIDALVESIQSYQWNGYQSVSGVNEPKTALAKYLSYSGLNINPENIYFTIGCCQAIDVYLGALGSNGQNILCPSPGWSHYQSLAEIHGIQLKFYDLMPEINWEIDMKQMESLVDENTAAIIYCNPSNPCGSVFRRKHILQIISFAEEYVTDNCRRDLRQNGLYVEQRSLYSYRTSGTKCTDTYLWVTF